MSTPNHTTHPKCTAHIAATSPMLRSSAISATGKHSGKVSGKNGNELNHTHLPHGEHETTGNDSGNKNGKSGKNGNAHSCISNEPIPGSAWIRPHHHRHILQNSGKNGNDTGNSFGLSSYHTN